MKVYILVDSEGEACITRELVGEKLGVFQGEYIRRRATEEAAAAVAGARDAGATDILVHDTGFIRGLTPVGLTLHYDDLPRGIRIALGRAAIGQVAAEGFDAALLVGYHAMAGTEGGVLAHTYSIVTIRDMTLNGRLIGEIGLQALQLGVFGIPVVMVSSDEAGCAEARQWLGQIQCAAVKRGLSAHAAVSLHPQDACDLIRSKAAAAVRRASESSPLTIPGPYELRVRCHTEEQAQTRNAKAGGEFVPPASYVVRSDSPLDLI